VIPCVQLGASEAINQSLVQDHPPKPTAALVLIIARNCIAARLTDSVMDQSAGGKRGTSKVQPQQSLVDDVFIRRHVEALIDEVEKETIVTREGDYQTSAHCAN